MVDMTAIYSELADTLKTSISGLYERILEDGSGMAELEVFRSLKDCQESRDYIVLRVEEMVRDVMGADRRQTLQRLVEENTECQDQLELLRRSLEQTEQQGHRMKTAMEALKLENDRLKFEVVRLGQHSEQQSKLLREELQQANDAANEARLKVEKAQAQSMVLAYELQSRNASIQEFTKKNQHKPPTKDQGVGPSTQGPSSEVHESESQTKSLEQPLRRSEVVGSGGAKPRITTQETATRSVKELKPQEQGSYVVNIHGTESQASAERILKDELIDYAKQIERLKSQLAEEQEKSANTLGFMKNEFEKMKDEVKEHKKQMEYETTKAAENQSLHQHIKNLESERDTALKERLLVERQLAETKQLLRGQSDRVEEMDAEVTRLHRLNNSLEAQLKEWKERLQRSQDVRSDQLQDLRQGLRQAKLKLHMKEQRIHSLESEIRETGGTASLELTKLIKENERLETELAKQKEQSTRKISEIDRLNRDLKAMYERKIELMNSTKEEHEKCQKHRSDARLLKEEAKEFKARCERLDQEVKLLEEKLIHLTKTNSQLEKESRSARNQCRALEKTSKEQEARITVLTEAAKLAEAKLRATKPKFADIKKKIFSLNAYCEDTKFKLIEISNLFHVNSQKAIQQFLLQIGNKMVFTSKNMSQENRLLQEQLNSVRAEQRRAECQQAEYLGLIQQLEDKLVDKQQRDSEELSLLEKQVVDLQRLCRKLQQANNENLREIEYLQKVLHQQRLEKHYKHPPVVTHRDPPSFATMAMLPVKDYTHLRDDRQGGMMKAGTTNGSIIVNTREVDQMQRHYDKLIRTLEDENIKLKSQTTRAELLFERELVKLNDMYRSRDRLIPRSAQQLPTHDNKQSTKQPWKDRSQNKHYYDLEKTREKSPSVAYPYRTKSKKHGSALTLDIKKDIEVQQRRLQENRRNLNVYDDP